MSGINKYLAGALMCLGMAVMELMKEEDETIKIEDFKFDGFLKNNEYGKQEQKKTDVE